MATKLAFTYENLRQIQIKEMKSSGLTRLEPEFYEDFFQHLGRLESEYRELTTKGEKETETVLLSEEIRKLRSLISSLYERRERKVIFLAQVEARGGKPETKNLTNLEKHLYQSLVGILSRTRSQLVTRVDDKAPLKSAGKQKEKTAAPAEPSEEKLDLGSEPKIPGTVRTNTKTNGKKLILVQILKDVAPFQDAEARKYYPKKEDIIHLPPQYAEILVKRGAARIIKNTF